MAKEESSYLDYGYYEVLAEKSRILQIKLSPILKVLKFDKSKSSAVDTIKAITYFQGKEGNINSKPPLEFLNYEERKEVISNDKIRISLYKALLFRKITENVKSGSLNLVSSYKFKALDEYMIPKDEWEENKELILKQAGLEKFRDCEKVLKELEIILDKRYVETNDNILNKKNQLVRIKAMNNFVMHTPAVETEESKLSDYLPDSRTVSMQEILSTVSNLSGFLKCFEFYKTTHGRRKPSNELIIAGIMSLGYGMGNNDIATISKGISSSALENIVNWCFTTENIRSAIDEILRLTDATGIPNLYLDDNKIHTSSDGQKWKVMYDSLNANYSFKYLGKDQGATVASFIDKRHFLFYSTVMSSSIREAAYVIDGLMYNEVVKSDIHSTDTHGYSEIVFGVTHFLSILFAPRIKCVKDQILSMFPGYKTKYKLKEYNILPTHTINIKIITEWYDEILRFIATIKLKRSTASQLLSRLNSYSTQHKLYQALKEFGKIIKSIFILKYIDDLNLRQSIEKQLNLIENNNKFSNAIAQENDHSFIQQTQSEQIIVTA
ncbi:Tn3 family transposase [Candidatus Jidaibacter acanthamoebae]|uniref:Tn3 family transposase n=1 Tax=Candidatus Jidaibacter acanthamoebae TaxID=86105 RepID=UPI0006A71A7C|nr:Tn3 family transposase [Candidatus Jidaibacter acanthamoeba]